MNNKTTKNTISSILLGFVLLSGSIAMAGLPTAAFAEERRDSQDYNGVAIAATPAQTEAALMTASASTLCDVTATPVDPAQLAVENIASQNFPSDGADYLLLSTGPAGIIVPNTATADSFSNMGGPDNLPFPADVQDGFGNDANDVASITVDCMIPFGVTSLSFDWGFGSEEPPTYTPSGYSDYFRTIGDFGNILALPGIAPGPLAHVTANNIDLSGLANQVTGSSSTPLAPLPSPDDSLHNAVLCTATSAVPCTQPQTTTIDVTAYQGSTISFGFEVGDDLDTAQDSTAWIDNLDTDAAGEIVKTCDAGTNICKTVIIIEEVDDGVIAVNELITYEVTITAMNNLGEDILNAQVKDNFGGDVEISVPAKDDVNEIGDVLCEVKLKGATEKAQVRCDANTFEDGEDIIGFSATVITDINPGQGKKDVPKNEYTSCGVHDMNSGATLSGELADGTLVEFSTDSVSVEVFEYADLSGDCDQDGFTDDDEINTYGTDPFDANDQPTCSGINTVDHCIDGDGYATPQRGTFTAVWGDALSNWPSFPSTPEGIDAMKTQFGWVIGVSDLHSEDPASCPTAIRDGDHDLGLDCKILDLNNDLVDQEQVHCDFETGLAFVGCPAFVGPNSVTWIESIILDGGWNNGEDIILDVNGNGVFD